MVRTKLHLDGEFRGKIDSLNGRHKQLLLIVNVYDKFDVQRIRWV